MAAPQNRQVLLTRRPVGAINSADFTVVDEPVPTPSKGQILLRNIYLSLDPFTRILLNDSGGQSAGSFALNAPMGGTTVSEIVESSNAAYEPGDRVVAQGGWQDYAVSDGEGLRKLPPGMDHPSFSLGVLGTTGFTAWHGLTVIGCPQPGETLVVGAASGAVGAIVGQIAKIKGCRVVGIAGGPEKCRHVVDDLGFDACIDHKDRVFVDDLAKSVPDGIDIYFESVGGEVFDAVWPHLNAHARIPFCGLVAGYDGSADDQPDRWPDIAMTIISKQIRMEGFSGGDYFDRDYDAFESEMSDWLASGKIVVREDVSKGLAQAPDAFARLWSGHGVGKAIVEV